MLAFFVNIFLYPNIYYRASITVTLEVVLNDEGRNTVTVTV